MKKNTPKADIWPEEPEEHDYPAAQDYLELLFVSDEAKIVEKLKSSNYKEKSKDILRASKLAFAS